MQESPLQDSDQVDSLYEQVHGGFIAMCSLLDKIELALGDDDPEKAYDLVMGRFDLAKEHGFNVLVGPSSSGQEQ